VLLGAPRPRPLVTGSPPLSAQRVFAGGAECPGRPDPPEPERLVPPRDARRLRAAGGQRVVRCVRSQRYVTTSCINSCDDVIPSHRNDEDHHKSRYAAILTARHVIIISS